MRREEEEEEVRATHPKPPSRKKVSLDVNFIDAEQTQIMSMLKKRIKLDNKPLDETEIVEPVYKRENFDMKMVQGF